jgi:ABC-type cobalamin transport system ATPase subunit
VERERWLKVERLYHAAREREGSERAQFLREACAGDESLLWEVESLLAEEGGSGSFLGTPALEVAAQALAHLGLGRAYALQGDKAKSRMAYQDFLALWKDADRDIPILKEAKAEYTKLK